MHFFDVRQRFSQALRQPEDPIDLATMALYIAQEEYLDLEVEKYLDHLDQMAAQVRSRLPDTSYPLRIIRTINQYLYEEQGFLGNEGDYYNPNNSFLNQVLDRRTGIPITLGLVYLEIARRINFPMVGVDMPGHFLIRPDLPEVEFLVDPFHQGEVLFREDCQERLGQLYGRPVEMQAAFLERSTPRRFLARMLTNLKMIYLHQGEFHKSLGAIERILLLFPDAPSQIRDRGILYYHLGNWLDAGQDLQSYLDLQPQAQDREMIQQLLARLTQGPESLP